MNKILEYEFIQTKDITYLAFIDDFIRQHINQNENAGEIVRAFSELVNQRRGN